MNTTLKHSVDTNLSISGVFSNSHFRRVIDKGESSYIDAKIKKYIGDLNLTTEATRKDVLDAFYDYLLSDYRCEYVYKSLLTKKILFGRHSINTTTQLNEFRVGNSLADLVLINGKAIVYEIKTELDTVERLEDQLTDYRKAFPTVYIVTHHTLAEKYQSLLKYDSIGLLTLSKNLHLSEVKKAESDYTDLDIVTMFKSLRKPEYSSLIKEYFGEIPNVPNMYFFKECLKLALNIDKAEFHKLMSKQLKKRTPKETELLESNLIPAYLSNICLNINPDQGQYERLFHFLNQKIN